MSREPMGTIFVPLFSYVFSAGGYMLGWASAPIDPIWARVYPRRAAWTAMAGPAANLALAVLAGLALRAGIAEGVFLPQYTGFASVVAGEEGTLWAAAGTILSIAFMLNLVLFVFNLFPVPPLDGATALGIVLPADGARRLHEAFESPAVAFIGFLAAWWLFRSAFEPVRELALRLLYGGVTPS
jgi:Zn-dependent protease